MTAREESIERQPSPPAADPAEDETSFALMELAGIVVQYKWIVLSLMAAACAATAVTLTHQPSQYQTQVSILIEPLAARVLTNVNEVAPLGTQDDFFYYATQHKILTSDSMIAAAVERLRTTYPSRRVSVADAKGKIQVVPVKETHLVDVIVVDDDPVRAALLANSLAEVYRDNNLNQKTEASRTAVEWLDIQSEELQKKLQESELALNRFKRDNDVLSLAPEASQNLLAGDISAVGSALSAARVKRAGLTAQVRELESALKSAEGEVSLSLVPGGESIKALLTQRKNVQMALAQGESRYLPDHPKVVQVRAELDKVNGLLGKEVLVALEALKRELQITKRFENDLTGRLERAKAAALDLNSKEADYNRILRDYETNKNLYSLVLTRSKETNLTRRLESNNVRILDRAEVPRAAISKRVPLRAGVASLAGLVAGIMIALGISQADQSVRRQEDITLRTRLPFLGTIPRLTSEKGAPVSSAQVAQDALIVHHKSTSLTAEMCRAIRSNLLFMLPDAELKCLVVTSPQHSDGKTSTAIHLALTLSQTQGKTLIVDADMRRPRLHTIFGVPRDRGLSTVITGECSLEDVIKKTEVPDVEVMSSGRIPPNAAELLHSARFAALIDTLKQRYSVIVFDTPPVMAVTDAVVLGRQVDGAVIVARWRQTNRHALQDTFDRIRGVGVRCLGIVLNDLDPTTRGAYYRYRSYQLQYRAYAPKASG